MRHYAKLLRATPTALLMLVVLAGAAVAQPIEDAIAAYERGDYATAYRLLRPLADQGDALAQTNLGFMNANGRGVPQDYSKALEWFGKAADQGFAIAQPKLRVMYYMGLGVPQDYAEAAKWYRKAADQGNGAALFGLGEMYDNGRGMPQDYAEAAKWYRKAADQGFAGAITTLAIMYAQGDRLIDYCAEHHIASESHPRQKSLNRFGDNSVYRTVC